jgi:hypothetical protein
MSLPALKNANTQRVTIIQEAGDQTRRMHRIFRVVIG